MKYSICGDEMASYREEEDPFEEDIVFDQAGLLNSTSKMNTAIRRVSSGKCVLFAKTLGLCGAFFGLGLCFAIPGPTFLSPLMDLENSLSPVSNIYVGRTSGYVVGSIIGGMLFDRFNRLFLLFLSLLLTAVFITVTPWCQALWILETCMIILGITMGFLDTGGNVLCLDLWGRNSGPFMQALHFSFGLGAFVAPLLAAPFLEPSLANATFSTEFSHSVTEFPVHLEYSKTIGIHEGRFRREIESMKNFPDLTSDDINRNVSSTPLIADNSANVSDVTPTPLLFGDSTFSSDIHSESFSTSTESTSTKPRVPKRKPSKIDASKLGTKNWDKVHVGSPPASDLLPLTTSSTPPPSPPPPLTQSMSLMPSGTESSATVSSDISTIAATLSSTLTSTDIPLSNLSTTSSGTSEEHGMPPSFPNKISNFSTEATRKFLSNSSITSASPPNISIPSSKALLSVQSLKDITSDETAFLTNNSHDSLYDFAYPVNSSSTKDSRTEEFKEIDIAKSKSEVFPRRQENSSEMSSVSAIPSRDSSNNLDTNLSRNNFLFNSEQSITDNQTYSSLNQESVLKKVGHADLLQHIIPEIKHLSREKAVFYNSNEGNDPVPGNVYSENTTPLSDVKSTWLNQDISGSIQNDPVRLDTFVQKSSNENGATTLNSIPIGGKLQQVEDVSSSPLEFASTLSSSLPSFGHAHHIHHKPGTFDNDTEHINTIFDIFANRIEKYGFNKIQFTYLIVGIFVFIISLVFLGFLCHNPRDPKSKQEGLGGKKITNKVVHKLLVALMAFFFSLYMGLEVTYGQLVLKFSTHSNLQLSVVFWGSFAAMRFASIFFSSGFSPLTMLMLNFAFCSSGTIIVSFLANHFETALWVGTALIGIGLASMFPTGILWIERYIHVSNKVAAVFVIGVALGELTCPVIIYKLMVIERMLFMYAALVINIVCILTFTFLWWLASRQGEKYSVINNNGYQLANQHDEEEDMMDMSPSGSGVMPRRHCFSSEHRALLNGNIHRGP